MSSKNYIDQNVYDATNKRLEFIFNEFDNVMISFSGGKDSGVLLNLSYEYAKKHNMTDKLALYTMDYEAGYHHSDEYIERVFNSYDEIKRKYWLCLPISAECSVSMSQKYWIPWDKDKEDIWVKQMPNNEYVVNEDNAPFDFAKGTYGKEVRYQFNEWFAETYGKTAVLIGLRADESLSRQGTITSQHRKMMYKNKKYSKTINDHNCNFYPIYDWRTRDIWIANCKFGWDYNKTYDLMYDAGLSIDQMRLASPFRSTAQDSLKLYRALEPDTWGKMISRVNGVNFMAIYGGTSVTGYKSVTKPDNLTWKEYAYFLLNTLPDNIREYFILNIERIGKTWKEEGYGRNPEVIATMEKEGAILEHTGVESDKCTKDNYYEIVKLKNGFLDETSNPSFRHIPSWKGVCVTILKNDFSMQYMGVSRTKTMMKKRREAIKKYQNIF